MYELKDELIDKDIDKDIDKEINMYMYYIFIPWKGIYQFMN